MASTITSIDTQIAKLAPTFQTAIKAVVTAESGSLNRTQAQKDSLDVRNSVYTDVKNNFDGLQKTLQALISSQDTYGMTLVSKASVTPGTVGSTVLSATTTSDSAAVADYNISVTQLAKAQSKSTSLSNSPDVSLGKSGTFWLGGSGTAALQTKTQLATDPITYDYTAFVPSSSVTAGAVYTVSTGQRELGAGDYALETRDLNGVRQFRLINADGNAVSIRNQADGISYTSSWQTMSDGSYDTGRGLNLTLNTSGATASTALTYTAAGTSISISLTDNLRNITSLINSASQPEGRDFTASIVANQLVLTGRQTGENHTMLYTDGASLGFGADLQVAQNAKFTVNGMAVSRSVNTGLTDVVDGATVSLASDAEGKSAKLSIAATSDKAAGLMGAMVSSFNTTLSHLKAKLAAVSSTVDGKTTYSRGPISGDLSLSGFRFDMLNRMNANFINSGSLQNFSEIGLSFDKDMKLTLDSTKFNAALTNNRTDVIALLDKGLGEINSQVASFTGSTGILSNTLASFVEQSQNYVNRITKYNENILKRKESLYNQYLGYQNQIVEYGYTAQWFGMITGTTGSNVNTSG